MSARYLDSSVLARVLLGSRRAVLPNEVLVTSDLSRIEVMQAINRLRTTGQLTEALAQRKRAELKTLLSALLVFPLGDEVLDRAERPFPFPVRATHALHVATAEVVRDESADLEVLTDDPEIAAAAAHRGFAVGRQSGPAH